MHHATFLFIIYTLITFHIVDSSSTDSPLEAAAGAVGPRAIEMFSILGNETRLSIMVTLQEAYEPYADYNAVAFSELPARVGMRDSGQFNHHLDKLAGHFIKSAEDGYELRPADPHSPGRSSREPASKSPHSNQPKSTGNGRVGFRDPVVPPCSRFGARRRSPTKR